jgi:hypothetical protein
VSERILLGPFLTALQASHRSGVPARELHDRPDILRIGGPSLEDAYFGFQFDVGGVRRDIGRVVLAARESAGDVDIADWLVRPCPALDGATPLAWLNAGRGVDGILAAVDAAGPRFDGRLAPVSSRPSAPAGAPRPHRLGARWVPAGG